jgi:hypothetical protein
MGNKTQQKVVFSTINIFAVWRFLRSNKLEELEFKLKKSLGCRNMQEKLENR